MSKITLKVGDVISLSDSKSGQGSKGTWMLIFKHADKGSKKMGIFLDNANDVDDTWRAAKIKEFTVTLGSKQDQNGNWSDAYTVNAKVEKASADEVGFMNVDADIDSIFA